VFAIEYSLDPLAVLFNFVTLEFHVENGTGGRHDISDRSINVCDGWMNMYRSWEVMRLLLLFPIVAGPGEERWGKGRRTK